MSDIERWTFRALSVGFFGSVGSAMGMGVAAVWEEAATYRVFASGAVIFGTLFIAAFVLALTFANAPKTEADSTENQVGNTP